MSELSVTASEFDAPETLVCPFPLYRQLRGQGAPYLLPGTDRYVVTRHEDVVYVTRHPELFSNRKPWLNGEDDPDQAKIAAGKQYRLVPALVDADPPEHTVYREIATRTFSPRRLRQLEPLAAKLVDASIDRFIERGEVEFVSEFCDPLPMRVICEFLGIPQEDEARVKHWSDHVIALSGRLIEQERAVELQRSATEMVNYLAELIHDRRAEPREDAISEFAAATTNDGRLVELPALLSIIRNLLAAGDETTSFLLANTMSELVDHPDQQHAVAADPSRIPLLIEESLRCNSPSSWQWRHAIADVEIGGVTIPAGSWVHVVWAAANRDEAVFERPEEFDFTRPDARRHLAFGYGIHFCIGAPLARMQGKVAFERLLARLREIELAGPPDEARLIANPSIKHRAVRLLRLRFASV